MSEAMARITTLSASRAVPAGNDSEPHAETRRRDLE